MARAKQPAGDAGDDRPAKKETRLTGSLGRLARGEPVAFLSGADAGNPDAIHALLAELDRQSGSDAPDCAECNRWNGAAMLALRGEAYLDLLEALQQADAAGRVAVAEAHGLPPPPECVNDH